MSLVVACSFGTLLVVDASIATVERLRDYRVIRTLAKGATTEILLATRTEPNGSERMFALKVLREDYVGEARFVDAFARGARTYARLKHPCIVQLHHVFSFGRAPVLVLEYVDGLPLSRVRAQLEAIGRKIDDMAAIHIAAEIFAALAAAHATKDEKGASTPVLHGHVSPFNVLIAWDGTVKLGDFGLPPIAGGEQVTDDAVTPQSDVYAAAIMAWELLARRRAFDAAKEGDELPPLESLRRDIDARMSDVLRRALDSCVENRNVGADEIRAVLRDRVSERDGRYRLAMLMRILRTASGTMPSVRTSSAEPPVPKPSGTMAAAKAPSSARLRAADRDSES